MAPEKIAFFGHHKCGSRYFRTTVLGALAAANGHEIVRYEIRNPPFHFRLAHDLDLANIDFERFAEPGRKLLNFGNASPEGVARAFAAAANLKGVHVVRDPRQVLVSGYFHHREGHSVENAAGWVWEALKEDRPRLQALPLEEGLLYELDHITDDILSNQIAPWRSHPQVIEFRIEEFDGATGYDWPAIERLTNFLGLEVLPPLDLKRTFSDSGAPSWREVFTSRLTETFKTRWGGLLVELGYETGLDWRA